MPIYPFKCERCGNVEDRFYASFEQMVHEPAPRCLNDGSRLERVASASNFSVQGYSARNGYAHSTQRADR